MSRYRWEGRCLGLKTLPFKLGLALDSVNGVKAMFLEPTFRLIGRSHILMAGNSERGNFVHCG